MSNSAYLTCCDEERIYPSFENENFDAQQHTLATCNYSVPLLWIALFRSGDIREQVFVMGDDEEEDVEEVNLGPASQFGFGEESESDLNDEDEDDSGTIHAWAPLTTREQAMANLQAAVPRLNDALRAWVAIDKHAALMQTLLAGSTGKYVSIELEEIDCMMEPGELRASMERIMDWLAGSPVPTSEIIREFFEVVPQFQNAAFPPARSWADGPNLSREEAINLANLLGVSHFRPVPWE